MKKKKESRATLERISRIGIINRGEAAIRFIRAVKEYNILYHTDFTTVALYLDMEREGLFVTEADVSCPLSTIAGFDKNQGSAYLNRKLMLNALKSTNCQGVWVGWGFLAEDAAFAGMVEEAGLVFIGPSSWSMALLGDKISAKEVAEATNVPILPWSKGPVKDVEEACMSAERIGYPVIIKASNTGGGRGIRFVRTPEELEAQYLSAREEALRITGENIVFMEHLVEKARHLEVQVLADHYGNVRTFGVRDCSVQRRNQKIIEETPPPGLAHETTEEIERAAARLIRKAHYENAGTVEFLYDFEKRQFYFMEVNTRLQVEHPITEQIYNIDLVKGQLMVACGKKLDQTTESSEGVAIEVRLNAEDPDRKFAPAPGKVSLFKPPGGPGIRIDTGFEEGSSIPAEFDSMIAKIIAKGHNREEAISRLVRALEEMRIKIEGGTSNRAFLIGLLNCPEIRQGGVHTQFVEELLRSKDDIIGRDKWDIALMACAIEKAISLSLEELVNFKKQWSRIGQPRDIPSSHGYEINLHVAGHTYLFLVKAVGNTIFHLKIEGELLPVQYHKNEHEAILIYNSKRYFIQMVPRDDVFQCEVNGVPYCIEIEASDCIKAPSPAIVISCAVKPGQAVHKGDLLLELEAMKLVMSIEAPENAKVKALCVREGEQVAAGQPLIQMEIGGDTDIEKEPLRARVSFQNSAVHSSTLEWYIMEREFLAAFLGYDYEEDAVILLEKMLDFVRNNPSFQKKIIECFLAVLESYVAIENLFSHAQIKSEGFARAANYQELLMHFFIRNDCQKEGLPKQFLDSLDRAIKWYPHEGGHEEERYNRSLFRIYKSHANLKIKQEVLRSTLYAMKDFPDLKTFAQKIFDILDEIALLSVNQTPSLADAAIQGRFHLIDSIFLEAIKEKRKAQVREIAQLAEKTVSNEGKQADIVQNIIDTGHYIVFELITLAFDKKKVKRARALELLAKYFNRDRDWVSGKVINENEVLFYHMSCKKGQEMCETIIAVVDEDGCGENIRELSRYFDRTTFTTQPELIILISVRGTKDKEREESLIQYLYRQSFPVRWCCLGMFYETQDFSYHTFILDQDKKWEKDAHRNSFNPLFYRELKVDRLAHFDLKILYSSEIVYLLSATAKNNQQDERLIALVDVTESKAEIGEDNTIKKIVTFEYALMEAIYALSAEQSRGKGRKYFNRIIIHVRSLLTINLRQIKTYVPRLAPRVRGLGLEKAIVYARTKKQYLEFHFTNISQDHITMENRPPTMKIIKPMTDGYGTKIARAKQRGNVYPYEIIKMLTYMGVGHFDHDDNPPGSFIEYDIKVNEDTGDQETFSVHARPYGQNMSNIVFGMITNYSSLYPHGIRRIIVLVDTTLDMGALAEKECRRVIAALDLAQERQLPVEWVPISAGAKIEMDSGTENLDWTARALKRIIEFTQQGGEINLIVSGVNVGAQSYWNAEATMLMHTKGILIMTEDASMLLTGKKALDFSGSVSAEDNIGIGGVERIMGPNGQAQIKVKNLFEAYKVLFQHYSFTYREHGKIFPNRQCTQDTYDRDICTSPYVDHLGQGFSYIGDIFSKELNPERKKPFDMRQVMEAVKDHDTDFLERWHMMKDAETAIVWETRVGGYAVGMLGIESRSLARLGKIPHDGPESWSGGTLFPQSSKKLARAINAFSGCLPLVILANLSGFDGSPESLRKLQLEYGAEIGRAIVNFKGPIIFVIVARYHGGAYVVFSRTLNSKLLAVALEGTYASVIGGAPAAVVVFPRKVLKETYADSRIVNAQRRIKKESAFGQKEFDELFKKVHSEKQTALAQRFDQVHSVERAQKVGSIHDIIPPQKLRPYLIQAIEKGMGLFQD
ncbi:MAG: carboxyl transferase domain-containing protein [bacterium]